MRRALWLAAVLAACGPPPPVATPEHEEAVESAGAVRVLALPRPAEGRVWLSLWLDAGAADADPPQLATVAAWALDAEARVLADGVELTAEAEADALEAPLSAWAARLSAREVDDAAITEALARLRRARRSDPARQADGLALRALVGRSVDPLGDAEDDARVTPQTVRAFLADHVGAGRLLLVAVGDVRAASLREVAGRAFDGLPAARRERPSREMQGDGESLALAVGDASAVALASRHADTATASAYARRLLARVDADGFSADVFPLRGGAVALVRRPDADDVALARLWERATELAEEPPETGEALPPDDARALAAWQGARWVGSGEAPSPGLALGVLVDGGRGDDLDAEDPDAATAATARAQVEELLEAARRGPALEGAVEDDRVDAQLENGARLVGRREPGLRRVAVAVLFDGGAEEEPAPLHGATALLAGLRAAACEQLARETLGAEVGALGVRVHPFVRTDAWGLTLEGPPERAAALASLAPRCATLEVPAHAVEAARPEAAGQADVELAQLAAIWSPDAPGRVAPLGSPNTLARLAPDALARWARRLTVGARAHVALVGPDALAPLARRAARPIARWPAGAAFEGAAWEPPEGVHASAPREHGARAWIAWSATARPAERGAGRALAAAAGERMARLANVRLVRAVGGFASGRAWAAVEVACDAEALEGLEAASQLGEIVVRAQPRDRWAGASAAGLAARLARPRPETSGLTETARRLAEGPRLFLIARPRE